MPSSQCSTIKKYEVLEKIFFHISMSYLLLKVEIILHNILTQIRKRERERKARQWP